MADRHLSLREFYVSIGLRVGCRCVLPLGGMSGDARNTSRYRARSFSSFSFFFPSWLRQSHCEVKGKMLKLLRHRGGRNV